MSDLAEDYIERMVKEADEILVRMRMKNTGESEERCRDVVLRIRSGKAKGRQTKERALRWQREYYQRMKAVAG